MERRDAIGFNEGLGGGEVFPFLGGVFEGVFDVTWLKGVGRFEEFAVFGDAAADACGEGEIDGFAWFAAKAGGFVKSSEIGIVGEENFGVE